ncbi:hypothetical protein PHMEG_00027915 [Phytophthora megakarya]|uniref:Uncharacterized protein n=1 Tax=Phytophthora megakarya TaxID=4795 RepID=A0A225V646_9STRA|nr:hypothetical protein PHMEG_00027915 [Phytophthora megakarya]
MSEPCTCSLQARLQQVENARSREMKTHGEVVRSLELELEIRRISEAESHHLVAKLRSDMCRLEAELYASNAKTRQLRGQLDTQQTQHRHELKRSREVYELQLQETHRENELLMEDNRQLNTHLFECRTYLENAKHDNKLLLAKNEEIYARTNTQAEEINTLSAQLTSKKQEIEAVTLRSQLLLQDLSSCRIQQDLISGRVQEVERDINHALVTRNRALNWRRQRHETWENQFLFGRTFLVWKAMSVQTALRAVAKMARHNENTRAQLQLVEMEIFKSCSQIKRELSIIRQECAGERTQIQLLRDEICQSELPKLLILLRNQQGEFETQRKRFELQCSNERECIEMEQERLKISRQDAKHRVQKLLEIHQKCRKHQQIIIYQIFAARRQRYFHQRTFSAWKELYLRSVVGQATHTAMVFQAQQPQMSIGDLLGPVDRTESQSWDMPAVIRPNRVDIPPLQLEKQHVDKCSEAATPIDVMWRKWRRVDAGKSHKPHASPITRGDHCNSHHDRILS